MAIPRATAVGFFPIQSCGLSKSKQTWFCPPAMTLSRYTDSPTAAAGGQRALRALAGRGSSWNTPCRWNAHASRHSRGAWGAVILNVAIDYIARRVQLNGTTHGFRPQSYVAQFSLCIAVSNTVTASVAAPALGTAVPPQQPRHETSWLNRSCTIRPYAVHFSCGVIHACVLRRRINIKRPAPRAQTRSHGWPAPYTKASRVGVMILSSSWPGERLERTALPAQPAPAARAARRGGARCARAPQRHSARNDRLRTFFPPCWTGPTKSRKQTKYTRTPGVGSGPACDTTITLRLDGEAGALCVRTPLSYPCIVCPESDNN